MVNNLTTMPFNKGGKMKFWSRSCCILALVLLFMSCNSTPNEAQPFPSWTEEEMLSVGDLSELGKIEIKTNEVALVGGKRIPQEYVLGKWYGQTDVSQQVFIDRKIWNSLSSAERAKAGQMSPQKVRYNLRPMATKRLQPQISAKLGTQGVTVGGYWSCWWIFCWWVEPTPPPPAPIDTPVTNTEEYVLTATGNYLMSAPDGIGMESAPLQPLGTLKPQAVKVIPLTRYVNVWGTISQATPYITDCVGAYISGSASTYIQATASSVSDYLLTTIYATAAVRRNQVQRFGGKQILPFSNVAQDRQSSGGPTTSQSANARYDGPCYGFREIIDPNYGQLDRKYRSTGWHSFVPPKGATLSFYTLSGTW
jgi:hypothetical protein